MAAVMIATCGLPNIATHGKESHFSDPELSIIFTCPSYHAQITYPNYQFGYTSHLTSLCSPNGISRPDVRLMGNGKLAGMRKEPMNRSCLYFQGNLQILNSRFS
jgi:hypothetical protein